MYSVYCLIKDGNPFYVGMTSNIKVREKSHKIDKDFDYLFVIKNYQTKKDALIAENSILRFLSLLNLETEFNSCFGVLKETKIIYDLRYKKYE